MTGGLDDTPYSSPGDGDWFGERHQKLEARMALLRSEGKLSEAMLRAYFTDKRFEQVAESNAIEGSRSASARPNSRF